MNFDSDMDWLEESLISQTGSEGMLGIEARQNLLTPDNVFLERAMDILISLVRGLVFLPIILLAALLVCLDSPGSIFYSQDRMGKDGRRITVYKFRSMRVKTDRSWPNILRKTPEHITNGSRNRNCTMTRASPAWESGSVNSAWMSYLSCIIS